MMVFQEYFKTPVYMENLSHWTDDINKKCDKHINEIKESKEYKERVKKKKSDFAQVAHSYEIATDPELKFYIDHIGQRSWEFLNAMGFDLSNHTCVFTECWVQEFPKDGGGHHNSHVHPNNHVSGFLYLKRDKDGPVPVIHDPRPAALLSALPEKNKSQVTYASQSAHWTTTPGTLIIMPAYVTHQYSIGGPNQAFRFIHFNIQAIHNNFMQKQEEKK